MDSSKADPLPLSSDDLHNHCAGYYKEISPLNSNRLLLYTQSVGHTMHLS